ncbi:MAG TPA: serine/threonine-protein kinase [Vicinamibacterales bacterium]|nr:serine/threonine-protein kinase [Vicinamibacterales bacterium]
MVEPMTPERWRQVKEVLTEALELDPLERVAFVEKVCRDDEALRNEVFRLLHADAQAGTQFLNQPLFLDETAGVSSEAAYWTGRRIGAYRVGESIGIGGMGEVYRGVRDDDQYHTEVAIKLVRAAPGSAFVGRFRIERQILADLNHPNIARLLDGGTTEEGVPYFVMELVEGQPIDTYCEAHELSVPNCLTLFLQVCSAVQYAHQRLIVHRDLKPKNILVTATGIPKLLDFGVAKLLHFGSEPSDKELTRTEGRFLTPEYASPEQVRGEAVTTATDVYSLGVILYELLTHRSPYRVSTQTPHEVARSICEEEPARPSTAVRRSTARFTTAAARALASHERQRKLARRLAGDLDTIVMKALRKEPERRYGSVEQLAEDIRRHTANLPVLARRDTIGYRSAKFIRRHAIGVSAALIVFMALSAAVGFALRSAASARVERARADQRFNDLRQLARSNLFELNDAIQQLPGSAAARNLVIQRTVQYLDKLNSESGGNHDLLEELAVGYERIGQLQGNFSGPGIGDSKASLESYQKAWTIREALVANRPTDANGLSAFDALGSAYAGTLQMTGHTADASRIAKRAVDAAEEVARLRPNDPRAVVDEASAHDRLATILGGNGSASSTREMSAALEHDRRALSILSGVPASSQDARARRAVLAARLWLAFHLQKVRAFDESARVFETIFSSDRNLMESSPALTATINNYHHLMFTRAGDDKNALVAAENDLRLANAHSQANPSDLQAKINLAVAKGTVGLETARLGSPKEGLAQLDDAIHIGEELLGSNVQSTFYQNLLAYGYAYQAEILSAAGDQTSALSKLTSALEMATNVAQRDPDDLESPLTIGKIHAARGVVVARAGRYADAKQELTAARERLSGVLRLRPDDREAAYATEELNANGDLLIGCIDGRPCPGQTRLRFRMVPNS